MYKEFINNLISEIKKYNDKIRIVKLDINNPDFIYVIFEDYSYFHLNFKWLYREYKSNYISCVESIMSNINFSNDYDTIDCKNLEYILVNKYSNINLIQALSVEERDEFLVLIQYKVNSIFTKTLNNSYYKNFDIVPNDVTVISLAELFKAESRVELGDFSFYYDIYYFTNKLKHFGAISLYSKQVLLEIAKKYSTDLFIIPVSIDGVIVIPKNLIDMNAVELKSILTRLNLNVTDTKLILSYNIYEYDMYSNNIKKVIIKGEE